MWQQWSPFGTAASQSCKFSDLVPVPVEFDGSSIGINSIKFDGWDDVDDGACVGVFDMFHDFINHLLTMVAAAVAAAAVLGRRAAR